MSKHSSLPHHFYVNVDNTFLGPDMPKGFTPAIWHGVYGRPYQLLLCHVLLESGAHWSGLPLHAISTTTDFSISHDQLMPWKTMGENMDVVYLDYLEGLISKTKIGDGRHTGIIVDWKDGYSRYQQEHKPLNLIHLDSGQFALQPNNYCRFEDGHFTSKDYDDTLKYYRRGEDLYWENN
jgi:hypothetical protein